MGDEKIFKMIQSVNNFPTWYEATAQRGAGRAGLRGTCAADVCVIGGGLAGLTSALELARRNKRVVLLEAKQLAWGASGRNGGFVSNGFAEGIENVSARVGLDANGGETAARTPAGASLPDVLVRGRILVPVSLPIVDLR